MAEDKKDVVEKAAKLEALEKSNKALAEQLEALRKRAEETEAMAKAERETRDQADMLKTVKDNYGNLGIDCDKVAPALYELRKSGNAEHYNAIVDSLQKTVDYRRRIEGPTGLFKSIGSSGSASPSLDAESEIEKNLNEMMAKSEYIGKSKAQVARDFYETPRGRELKTQARAEARGEA